MRAPSGVLVLKLHLIQCSRPRNAGDEGVDSSLEHDTCSFAEEGFDGGGGAVSAASGPALYSSVVDACHGVL